VERGRREEIGECKLRVAEVTVESVGCDGVGEEKSAGTDSIYVDKGWQAMSDEFTTRAAR
jgi:hypothetical protein